MRGQSSFEYIILMGMILVILIPVFYYSTRESSQNINVNQGNDVVNSVANTVNSIYSLGPGNKEYIQVVIPGGIESVNIEGNEVAIKMHAFGDAADIFATTIANVTGQIPTRKGPALISIEVLDSGVVLIGSPDTFCGDGNCESPETCDLCSADCCP